MSKLLIKQGRVVDPANQVDLTTDLLIEDGLISAMGDLEDSEAKQIDARGLLVMPGAIDLHVHLRDLHQKEKETIATGTLAARAGGVTTLFAMPNTMPPLDNEAAIRDYQKRIHEESAVEAHVVGSITKELDGKELAEIETYRSMGLRFISDDGHDVNDENLYKEAFRRAKEHDLTMIVHPESDAVGIGGVVNEGKVSETLGVPGQPNEKESQAVERAIRLAKETGARVHLTHLTTKESVELVRRAKLEMEGLTCDVTPHHIAITDELVLEKKGFAKVNPPLRNEADRLALIEGIKDGTVDCIATDHAPHTFEQKNQPLEQAAFGFTGLETMLPVTFTELVDRQGMELSKVVELLTSRPAQIANLERGSLSVGSRANVVMVDLEKSKPVDSEEFRSKGKNTPFDGMELKGWPRYIIMNGQFFTH